MTVKPGTHEATNLRNTSQLRFLSCAKFFTAAFLTNQTVLSPLSHVFSNDVEMLDLNLYICKDQVLQIESFVIIDL